MNTLNERELERYDRHLKLPSFGLEAQLKLKNARVLLVGAGGLGCPIGLYLAAAGVGQLTVADFDSIDLTNLQRQIAHRQADLGKPKVLSLVQRMSDINDAIEVIAASERMTADTLPKWLHDVDLVLDGTDNFSTRYLINDACFFAKKPLVYGAIHQFEGQVSVFGPGGPCYRCLFPTPPPPESAPNCAEAGVLGVLPGTVGLLMATEAIKVLAGIGQPLLGKLLLYDALDSQFRTLALSPDPDCPLCGEKPQIQTLTPIAQVCAAPNPLEITWALAEKHLAAGIPFLDVREPFERERERIEPSHWIPLNALSPEKIPFDEKDLAVVYCAMGGRSLRAVETLRSWGYQRTFSLQGGIRSLNLKT
ncbi:MAG: molybdopterin-synthase adenylyltransferase MoeB [Acidobacteria bacterium]|nr:molybdopterin-synthase adenylyltransferase MoeB [Acidobacteriota bacterium]